MKVSRKKIGQRIKELRKKAGLNQADFGKKVRIKKQNYVSRIENGKMQTFPVLVRIAKFGNVSLDWLLTGVEFQDRQKQSAA